MPTPIVTRTTYPAHTVAYLRDTIESYMAEGELWPRFMEQFIQAGAAYEDGAHGGAIFHDDVYRESNVDVEIWTDIVAGFSPDTVELSEGGTFGCRTIPEQETITATLLGDYMGMSNLMEVLGQELTAQGLTIAGPMFNIYLVSPGQEPDPAKWVTEVHIPVQEAV